MTRFRMKQREGTTTVWVRTLSLAPNDGWQESQESNPSIGFLSDWNHQFSMIFRKKKSHVLFVHFPLQQQSISGRARFFLARGTCGDKMEASCLPQVVAADMEMSIDGVTPKWVYSGKLFKTDDSELHPFQEPPIWSIVEIQINMRS